VIVRTATPTLTQGAAIGAIGVNQLLARLLLLGSVVVGCSFGTSGWAAQESTLGDRERWLQQLLQQRWTGDLDGMMKRRTIRVLVVYSKTYYFVDNGAERGTAYDALKLFEKELNAQLKKKNKTTPAVHVVFLAVSRDQLIPGLLEGRGDIAAGGITITPSREAAVEFSDPLVAPVDEVIVTGPTTPVVKTLDDLSGQEIFVRKSTSYYEHLVALNQKLQHEAHKAPIRLKVAPESLQEEDLMEMLNAGLVTLLVVDEPRAELWSRIFPKITVRQDLTINSGGEIAWMFRPHSVQLASALNAFIARHPKGDATRAEILRKYLKSTKFVKDAGSPAELRKFNAMVELFKKYGAQYEFDYLMMMAQGYQESRLDQRVKSRAGAIGVMQVMPSTGRSLKVGDILEVEPNIHAGVKYMSLLSQQYFANEPMDELNKDLFTFAAYNAGAARIKQLRGLAGKRGFNPNVWFGNVEIVAREKIGSETVTYVSNIFKYYVAYALVAQAEQERKQAEAAMAKP
jgi:membrane-bound lytic murein transglycosylase MltF